MTRKILLGTLLIAVCGAGSAFAQGGPGRDARPSFETLDLNKDGSVTQEEIDAAGQAHFATLDTDSNGALNKEELLARAQERAAKRIDRMIERLDADNDGALTLAELDARRGQGRMMERLDADGDGAISQAEFDAGPGKARKPRKGRKSDNG